MTLETILEALPEVNILAGNQVFQQGQTCENDFILTAGSGRVFTRSATGKELVSRHLKRFESEGLINLRRGHIGTT